MEYQKITNLIENKIADAVAKSYDCRITKVSKNPETVTNENDKEIPNERYISPQERGNNIDNLDIHIIV